MKFDPEILDPNGAYRQWIRENPESVIGLTHYECSVNTLVQCQ